MSQSANLEQFTIEKTSRNCRTEIPNILFLLDLSPEQKAVYLAMRQTAGEAGVCLKSSETLAKEARVNIKTYRQCKKFLCQIQPLINKPLIKVTERKEENKNNLTSLVQIIDIWDENYQYYYCQNNDQKDTGNTLKNTLPPTSKNGGTPTSKNGPPLPPKTEVKEEYILDVKVNDVSSMYNIGPTPCAVSAEAEKITEFLIRSIKKRDRSFKEPKFDKWAIEIDRLMRIDLRPKEEICQLIKWTETHHFWKGTILSAANLRKNYSKIKIQYDSEDDKRRIIANRNIAIKAKQDHPKELKLMSFDDKYVRNLSLGKEIPFNLPTETFKESFASLFGGKYERRV
jgi:hypothetical protein